MHSGFGMRPVEASGDSCVGCHVRSLHGEADAPPGPIRDRIEGTERLVVRSVVPFAGDRWILWASMPMAEILRPLAQQQITSMLFTGLVVVVLVLGGLLLRRAQIRRIHLESRLRTQERLLGLADEKERLQVELEDARRMATIGLMVSRVAHEVKNPLQYIGTGVELLGATVKGEDAQELVRDLKTGVRTLDSIVKELLDFGRPMKVHRMPTQLNDLMAEVARRVLPPEVEAVLELDPDLPEVEIDPYKILQVMENLARNAVEALAQRPEGLAGARVRLGTRRLSAGPGAGGVAFRVHDNGPGIPDEDVAAIWDPFFTTKTRGTGLGLAVVRRIVEAHGGSVHLCSHRGEGACFEVHLGTAPGVS
jgi:signal transduction histidine kinase